MSTGLSFRRAGAVFRVEAHQLIYDRSALLLILVLPIMQLLLYGYAVSFMPKHVPVAVATANPLLAARLPALIADDPLLRLVGPVGRPGDAARRVREGKAVLGVELSEASGAEGPQIHIFADASDPATVRPALASLQLGAWRKAAQYYGGENTPEIATSWMFGAPDREAWAVAPGLVGVIVMVSMLFLGAMTLVRERERGTWESLLSTPVRPAEALLGKLSPYLAIGVVETALLLALIHGLFAVPLPPASLMLVAAAPLFAGAYLVLGFAFSALAQTQLQAVQGAVAVYLPSLLLSGFLFPFSGMPRWAQIVGECLPITHYLRASREILLRHSPAAALLPELPAIALFAAAALALALAAYRTRLD